MDIEKKKRMVVVIKGVIKRQRGSFTIGQLKEKMNVTLRHRNFVNDFENEKEISEFIKKIQREKRLFKYDEDDNRYFFVR